MILQKQLRVNIQQRRNENINIIEKKKRFVFNALFNKQKRKRQKTKNDKIKFKDFRESMKKLKTQMIDNITAMSNTLTKIFKFNVIFIDFRVDRLKKNVELLKTQSIEIFVLIKQLALNANNNV